MGLLKANRLDDKDLGVCFRPQQIDLQGILSVPDQQLFGPKPPVTTVGQKPPITTVLTQHYPH